jgi:hypothetical protein
MIYEHFNEPLLSRDHWLTRVYRSAGRGLGILFGALMLGVGGYHFLGHLRWIDALLEASMILGGMGAIAPMTNDAVKLFASFYALFSGLVVLSTSAVILAPWLHRMLHAHFGRDG